MMVESDLSKAEASARKRHGKKGNGNADKFVASERLRVLGLHLKEDIKRFREPGAVKTVGQKKTEGTEQTLGDTFFKLKAK